MDALLAEFGSETVYRCGYEALGFPPTLIHLQGEVEIVRRFIQKKLEMEKERGSKP